MPNQFDCLNAVVRKISGNRIGYNVDAGRYIDLGNGRFVSRGYEENIVRNVALTRALRAGGLINRINSYS